MPITATEEQLYHWKTDAEGQYFDRKSARLAPKDLAAHLSAFANASGGTIVLGIEDDGNVTGVSTERENTFRQVGIDFLEYIPEMIIETYYTEASNQGSRILVISLQPSHNRIIKTKSGDAYLRVGDQSRKLNAAQLLEMEYSRGTRSFETTIVEDAVYSDLDSDLINEYYKTLKPEASNQIDIMKGRGLIRSINGEDRITVAGILLLERIQRASCLVQG